MDDKLKYFKIAKQLNLKYNDKLKDKKLHFRGNINSFSLISLDRLTPERGISGLNNYERGENALNNKIKTVLERINGTPKEKTRPTPEKDLQAWIINFALTHREHILPFGSNIEFITSELAMKCKQKYCKSNGCEKTLKRVVNDILGFDIYQNLVIIELKSERNKTELEKQIICFYNIIQENHTFFEELTNLLVGKSWSGSIKNMIVCPGTQK